MADLGSPQSPTCFRDILAIEIPGVQTLLCKILIKLPGIVGKKSIKLPGTLDKKY
jgi:hypothetical protein